MLAPAASAGETVDHSAGYPRAFPLVPVRRFCYRPAGRDFRATVRMEGIGCT
jgi:hypothetical protein